MTMLGLIALVFLSAVFGMIAGVTLTAGRLCRMKDDEWRKWVAGVERVRGNR
jgi:hypothetical protein